MNIVDPLVIISENFFVAEWNNLLSARIISATELNTLIRERKRVPRIVQIRNDFGMPGNFLKN